MKRIALFCLALASLCHGQVLEWSFRELKDADAWTSKKVVLQKQIFESKGREFLVIVTDQNTASVQPTVWIYERDATWLLVGMRAALAGKVFVEQKGPDLVCIHTQTKKEVFRFAMDYPRVGSGAK